MNKHRKTWSLEDKLQIVQSANDKGVSAASAEFGVSTQMIYNWRSNLEEPPNSEKELHLLKQKIKSLERDVVNLRDVVADQSLAIKIKDAIIKKKIQKGRL